MSVGANERGRCFEPRSCADFHKGIWTDESSSRGKLTMKMKRSLLALALLGAMGTAGAGTISDDYWGGEPQGYGDQDVMGLPAAYDVSSLSASLSGTILTINITTNFAGRAGLHPDDFWDPRDNTLRGIGYGDLFLARDWEPFGTAPYVDDNYSNGTVWEYGFALDDSYSNVGGSGILYALNSGDNATSAWLAQDAVVAGTNPSRRDDQEILVKDTSEMVNDTGEWWVTPDPDINDGQGDSLFPDSAQGVISFAIDIAGTTLLDEITDGDGSIAIRWTMFCANDVIEGEVSLTTVSAPASLLLLGLGLAALGAGQWRRRREAEGVAA